VKLFWSFYGKKSLNTWAIEICFNEEKGQKNEKNSMIYFEAFTL
jgi:hypothetical protein